MKETKTIRLIYPQWQGAKVDGLLPELDTADASTGYYLGAQLLEFLAPRRDGQETLTVPVAADYAERTVQDGVYDRDIIARQSRAALEMLCATDPGRIVTLGGECSVSVVPFTYLAEKYGGDVAMVWIDAHPDITLPGDPYPGYHAMAAAACMGMGDGELIPMLPARIDPAKTLIVACATGSVRKSSSGNSNRHTPPFAGRRKKRQRCRNQMASGVRSVESGGAFRYGRARPFGDNPRRGCSSRRAENSGSDKHNQRHRPGKRISRPDHSRAYAPHSNPPEKNARLAAPAVASEYV